MNEESFSIFQFPLERLPTHPGEILRDYWEDLGITQGQLAERLGVSFQAVNELINGKRGVSSEMAIRLSTFFKTSIELWLGMQNKYDIYKVLREDKKANELKKIIPFEYDENLKGKKIEA